MLASMYSYCARNQQVFNPIVFLKYFTFVLLNPLSWIGTSASLAEEHSWSQDGDSTSSCNTLHPSWLHPCSILWPFHLCWEDSFLEQGLKHGWCGQLWLWTYAWSQISPNVIMMCRVTRVRCTWTKGGWVSKQATQYSGGSLLLSRTKSRSSRGVGSIAKSWFKTTSENLIKMSNLIFSKGLGRWHHQPQPWLWKQICQQCHQCWGAQLW